MFGFSLAAMRIYRGSFLERFGVCCHHAAHLLHREGCEKAVTFFSHQSRSELLRSITMILDPQGPKSSWSGREAKAEMIK